MQALHIAIPPHMGHGGPFKQWMGKFMANFPIHCLYVNSTNCMHGSIRGGSRVSQRGSFRPKPHAPFP